MTAELPIANWWAYRYHDCIRFNHGETVNGSDPIESIPVYDKDSLLAFSAAQNDELTRQLEYERVPNIEKLRRERETKRHWQERAEKAEREVADLRAQLAQVLKGEMK